MDLKITKKVNRHTIKLIWIWKKNILLDFRLKFICVHFRENELYNLWTLENMAVRKIGIIFDDFRSSKNYKL